MTYGVGVVGSGFMGRTWSTVVQRHVADVDLVGITGGRRAAALAADYDVPVFATVDDLLAERGLDIVVLASPPATHLDQAVAAAAASKHVLIEKPMAQDVAECRAIIEASVRAGTQLAVVSQHRFRDAPVCAKGLLDNGVIGPVRMVRVIGPTCGFWDTSITQDEWKLDPNQQTTYASWAAHACDILRWFVGSPATEAFAYIDQFGDSPPPGRSAMAMYRFESGAMAQVWMSYEIPQPGLGSGLQFELIGERGIVQLDSYGAVRLGTADGWSVPFEQVPFDPLDPTDPARLAAYVRTVDDLVDAVDNGRPPLVDGREGLATIAMIAAAELSASTGQRVDVMQQ